MAIRPFSDPSALSLQIPSLASHYINYKWQSSPGLSGSRQSLENASASAFPVVRLRRTGLASELQ